MLFGTTVIFFLILIPFPSIASYSLYFPVTQSTSFFLNPILFHCYLFLHFYIDTSLVQYCDKLSLCFISYVLFVHHLAICFWSPCLKSILVTSLYFYHSCCLPSSVAYPLSILCPQASWLLFSLVHFLPPLLSAPHPFYLSVWLSLMFVFAHLSTVLCLLSCMPGWEVDLGTFKKLFHRWLFLLSSFSLHLITSMLTACKYNSYI